MGRRKGASVSYGRRKKRRGGRKRFRGRRRRIGGGLRKEAWLKTSTERRRDTCSTRGLHHVLPMPGLLQ